MWIKVCGTTSLQDAHLAVDAGADALGFIFAASPRQITPETAGAICRELPERVEKYGVFVHPSFDQIIETVAEASLSGVQIHATDDPTLFSRLRTYYSVIEDQRRIGILRVLHYSAETTTTELASMREDHSVDAVLLDSRTAAAQGGTGLRFDWAAASGSVLSAAPQLRVVVAGGLSPENVAEAIATLRPWGVDVVSGVESSPGKKNAARLRAFIDRARMTANALATPLIARA